MSGGELWFLFIGAVILWWVYMLTFRTDDAMRLMKADQERKAKRDERIVGLAKGAARFWLKK